MVVGHALGSDNNESYRHGLCVGWLVKNISYFQMKLCIDRLGLFGPESLLVNTPSSISLGFKIAISCAVV